MNPDSPQPVIVTRREIERLFIEKDAESAIHEAAQDQSSMEHAQAMAMTGAILREIQKAEHFPNEFTSGNGKPVRAINRLAQKDRSL